MTAAPTALLLSLVALAGCSSSGSDTPATSSAATASSAASDAASPADSPSASASPAAAEEPTMGELYAKVRKTALAAKSGHVTGRVTSGKEKVSLDIEGTVDGTNQRAVVTIGSGEVEILTVKKKYYLSGDAKFWREQTGNANAAKVLVGKYVKVSGSDAKAVADLSIGSILDAMFTDKDLGALADVTSTVETRSVKGQDVWVASDPSGSEIWVDPETERLMKIVITGDDAGQVTFSDWDAAETVSAPPAGKVLSL
ncbi:hypothetical protein [Phycicoccus flavus]|uniref:Lipoprotein n=1 Tax=Phycicoccus flavus TaxID=2502783 RepID=A0A8T6R5U8_9MICO|nr:hypothetical protein [Phycicoccus flavus]NHA67601.1 hypothetical protein [Phycicoccus flavus]